MTVKSYQKQQGVTLIEAIIFLSILSVILGVVLNKASIALSSNRASQSTDSAQLIASGIKAIYQLRTDYTGLNTRSAIANGVVPEYMMKSNQIIHAWGGTVSINGKTESGISGFEISFANVPAGDCAKFVNSVSAGFQKISVGSRAIKAINDTGAADPAVVGAECGNSGTKTVALFSY